jgi:hypothetical protein
MTEEMESGIKTRSAIDAEHERLYTNFEAANERYREAYRGAKRPHDWIQRAQEMEVAFKELKAFAATYAPIYLTLPER